MTKLLRSALVVFVLSGMSAANAQTTTLTTGIPSSPTTLSAIGQTPGITFIVSNTNSYPIIITSLQVYRDAASSGKTWTLWYSPTSLSGPSAINAAAGWTTITTAVAPTASSTGIHPVFPVLNFQIPANTIYRFYVTHSGDIFNYGSAASTPNNFSAGGVMIGTGNYLINSLNVGHAGYSASLSTAFVPRFFGGTITFDPGSANNLQGLLITQPLNNSQNCYGASMPVRVRIKNTGSAAQSNFQVGATYTGPQSGNLTGVYTGTLAPGVTDSIDLGPLSLQPGNYTIEAYTLLATDTLPNNDTTPPVSFVVNQPVLPPVTVSDTVCAGMNAFIYVNAQLGGTYKWYSDATAGSLVNIGNVVNFPTLTQDTTMYISATINNCEGARSPIHAIVGPPPVVSLGADTSFCESVPLILDGGNPGGVYTWSTGDSVQSITVTNVSGTYWVTVDKYCTASDTINVTIAPMPDVSGISFVRSHNVYSFSPSAAQFVDDYLWIFGDGTTSTLSHPTHTFDPNINVALTVQLIVSNECGTDTAMRSVPTAIHSVSGLEDAIAVFPNPASDRLFITSQKELIEEICVVGMLGNVVMKEQAVKKGDVSLNIAHLPAGNYIIRIHTDKGDISRPVQVIR